MSHRVIVWVDRAEAIRAGKNAWGHQTVELNVTALDDVQRAELALVPWRRDTRPNTEELTGYRLDADWLGHRSISEATPAVVAELLTDRAARREQAYAAWMARPLAEIWDGDGEDSYLVSPTGSASRLRLDQFRSEWPALFARRHAEIEQAIADKLARQAAERESTICEWLAKPADDLLYHAGCGTWEVRRPATGNSDPRVKSRLAELQALIPEFEARRQAAEHEELVQRLMTGDIQRLIGSDYGEREGKWKLWYPNLDDPRLADRQAEAARLVAEHNAEIERRAQERPAYIARIIAEHGTRNQQERLAAGALPLGEATALAEQVIFAALDGEPRYEKLTRADAEHSDECDDPDDCHVGYDADVATEMPGCVWDAMQSLRQKLGRDDATIEARRHVATTACEVETERWGIRIQVDEGGYEFAREYACDTPQED